MIPHEWLEEAHRRLEGRVQRTPLSFDPDNQLYLKWENRQRTGSFKLRGAYNKLLTLQPWELERGLVTASAGNHGQGAALAARELGARVIVFASAHAVPAKLDAMRALGAEVVLVPGGYEEGEGTARKYAQERGLTWVSPYNDGQVIAGQSTIAAEILEQLEGIKTSAWVAPVGGGGMIAGIGAVLQQLPSRPKLIGAQSVASPYFHALFHRGTQAGVQEQDSIADGLAGAVEEGSITIPLVRRLVDVIVLVQEQEIEQAVVYAWERYGERIEGSAAAALAAVLTGKVPERPAVVVLSGGNIQPELHSQLLARWEAMVNG